MTRRNRTRLIFYPSLVLLAGGIVAFGTCMPGKSFSGALPPLTDEEKKLADELRAGVQNLGSERNLTKNNLAPTVDFLEGSLKSAGFEPRKQIYDKGTNLDVEIAGSKEIVVVGAHYDSAMGAAGADDNGSGCAAVLALARRFHGAALKRTLRLALFANEEAPYFGSDAQGSLVYARACKERGDDVVAMISLEMLGYYDSAPHSQHYPWGFGALYPDRGDFIGFVGDVGSRSLVRDAIRIFRDTTQFPSEGAALPRFVPGVGWSDHWSFWQAGFPAIMITDTAMYRNPHYHLASDTPETLDYERFARVVLGVERVVRRLCDR